jgi:hypothetical protein
MAITASAAPAIQLELMTNAGDWLLICSAQVTAFSGSN